MLDPQTKNWSGRGLLALGACWIAIGCGLGAGCNAILGFDEGQLGGAAATSTAGAGGVGGTGGAAGTGGADGGGGRGGSQPLGHLWSHRFGDAALDAAKDVAIDAAGNIYVVGWFRGEIDFGCPTGAHGSDQGNVYVVKLDPAGQCQWSKGFGIDAPQPGLQVAEAVVALAGGAILVAGSFEGGIDFGCTAHATTDGAADAFVAKLDADGECLFSEQYGGQAANSFQRVVHVAVDGDESIYLAGRYDGDIDFGSAGVLNAAGDADVFLVKLADDGDGATPIWAHRIEVTGASVPRGVLVDGSGAIYLVGEYQFEGGIRFGGAGGAGGTGGASGAGGGVERGVDLYAARYDTAGDLLWSAVYGSESSLAVPEDFVGGAALDGAGDLLFCGGFHGEITFGGAQISASATGTRDAFLAGISADMTQSIARAWGEDGLDNGRDIAVDGNGDLLMVGTFSQTINFGGEDLVGQGLHDIFLAKFNAQLVHISDKSFGDGDVQSAAAIAVDGDGNSVIVGNFLGTVDFGGGPRVATPPGSGGGAPLPEWDVYVAKFGP